VTPATGGDVAALADQLVRRVARAWPAVAGDPPALAAIDEFVARPSPSRYLRAARLIYQAAAAARGSRLDEAVAGRAHAQGLERLRASGLLDPARGEALAAYPVDRRAGHRLSALAMLLDAHRELTARVRQSDADRRSGPFARAAVEAIDRRAPVRRSPPVRRLSVSRGRRAARTARRPRK
jgi:hypothetical protein